MALYRVLACVALWFRAALSCNPAFSLPKCNQIKVIGQAVGRGECQYLRDFYRCLLLDGCYYLPDACLTSDTDEAISCKDLCETEPGLAYCTDDQDRPEPEEDFHLCPHISKAAFSSPPPTEEELQAAVPLPFSVTGWTAFTSGLGGLHPSSVLPSLWAPAMATAMASLFRIHASTVVIQEPVAYRSYPLTLEGAPVPPDWTEQTTFFIMRVLVVDQSKVETTRLLIKNALVGSDALNISAVELAVASELNSTLPANSRLELSSLKLHVISGQADDFPIMTSTTLLTTYSTTLDIALRLRLWQAWRVRCADSIAYRWEIVELQFWVDACPSNGGQEQIRLNSEGGGNSSSHNLSLAIISSGEHNASSHPAARAFDAGAGAGGRGSSSWLARCGGPGCAPGEAWLGLEAAGGGPRFTAACAVVKQAESPSGQCSAIALEASDNASDPSSWEQRAVSAGFSRQQSVCIRRTAADYPLLQCGTLDNGCGGAIDFGTCPGYSEECETNRCKCLVRTTTADDRFYGWECGTFGDGCDGVLDFGVCDASGGGVSCEDHLCIQDEPAAMQWRLVCESGTPGRWWVKELEFHVEGMCFDAYRAFRASIASGSYRADHPVVHAFDGDEATLWGSQCSRCPPRAAWIGVDFGVQVKVACVKLIQDSQSVQQCAKLALEYSDDGIVWIQRHRYGFGKHVLRSTEILQADTDERLDDSTLQPHERSAPFWRLACSVNMQRSWGVFELEFFDNRACTSSLRGGTEGFVASATGNWPAQNAFDGRGRTLWKSRCGNCEASDAECIPCERGKVWIGVQLRQPAKVLCVKLSQLEPDRGACPQISLQFSVTGDEDSWLLRHVFKDPGEFAFLVPPVLYAEGGEADPDMASGAARINDVSSFGALCLAAVIVGSLWRSGSAVQTLHVL